MPASPALPPSPLLSTVIANSARRLKPTKQPLGHTGDNRILTVSFIHVGVCIARRAIILFP